MNRHVARLTVKGANAEECFYQILTGTINSFKRHNKAFHVKQVCGQTFVFK